MNNSEKITRRHILGGLGVGLASLVVNPVVASPVNGAPGDDSPADLENPTTKYPRPPFKDQKQPWPGLAKQMDPVPDHGEKSYKGSGRLKDRKALVTGGDSGIGRAAAIAYAREGADVAINYHPSEESDAQEVIALIKAEGRKAIAIPGDIRDEA
ncbi:MAG TPA: SDR family NAD(P)-dependent oxidoreductase, partial [Niastella sp.]|nr:SDR family NAD(P)-dependent oxidoreductase [Niastella sp.]